MFVLIGQIIMLSKKMFSENCVSRDIFDITLPISHFAFLIWRGYRKVQLKETKKC